MTMETANTKLLAQAEPLLAELGEELVDINFLAKGATCEVWRLSAENRSYALKIIREEGRVFDGRIDAFIRRRVVENGGALVAPLLDSESFDQTLNGKRWILEPFIAGHHPQRGRLPKAVCARLGETLAALHDISVDRFGRPSEVLSQTVIGKKSDAFDGVAQRFENPIPETWADHYIHPSLAEAPDLSARISTRLSAVSEQIRHSQPVLCHTDVHEKQLICASDKLVALIDFGEAAILDRHWDLGSVLYFHGEPNFSNVFEAYVGNGLGSHTSFETVASFSIAIAMHHASRSRLPGKHHRLAKAIDYIRYTV